MARPTIKDIAKKCGVSFSTVSLVLNNNPRITQATREKVLAEVERCGYQPNASARGLASKYSYSLSVVVPHLNHVFADVYFGEIVSGIYEAAVDLGYKVLLDVANRKFLSTKEYMKLLRSRRVDGMLYVGSSIYDDFLFELENSQHAMVLVNHHFPGHNLNYIAADYTATGQLAAQHLLGLGHRKIGLVCGTNTNTALEFQKSFFETCAKGGVAEIPWADGWFTDQGGFEGTHWLFERHPDLTAIMAGNDRMALGALRALRQLGKKIPDDVSVMGVDDLPLASIAVPGLTTVRHELYQIGRAAVEGILSIVSGKAAACRQTLPVKIVHRESTAPAKK